jgi:protein-disulfide isomerase/uncharacterized membrane protein
MEDSVKSVGKSGAALILVSVILGLIFAVMSLYTHEYVRQVPQSLGGGVMPCDISEAVSCSRVELSPYSELLGIPIASFGIMFFGLVLFLYFVLPASSWVAVAFVGGLAAVATSAVLLFVSKVLVGSLCLLCIGSYIASILLLITSYVCRKSSGSIALIKEVVELVRSCFTPLTFPGFCGVIILALFLIGGSQALMGAVVREMTFKLREEQLKKLDESSVLDSLRASGIKELGLNLAADNPNRDFAIGAAEAPVKIVEFGDFQCPSCQSSFRFIKSLVRKYAPQIQFVYRNFPLDQTCNSSIQRKMHPYACHAAELARCGGEQDKFFDVGDIFTSGNFFPEGDGADIVEKLTSTVVGNLLDKEKLIACDAADRQAQRIGEDVALGIELGINATPTIFINGYQVAAPNDETIRAIVVKLLAEKGIGL